MCALARTTVSQPSFIFMGGDNCHHAGQFRPTEYLPLPDNIKPSPLVSLAAAHTSSCPGEMFLSMHHSHSRTEPFYSIAVDKNGASLVNVDVEAAKVYNWKDQRPRFQWVGLCDHGTWCKFEARIKLLASICKWMAESWLEVNRNVEISCRLCQEGR